MIDINAADVYRKAAEVIVRDGKCEGRLIKGGSDKHWAWVDALADRSLPVCALGACARAEYELYGTYTDSTFTYDNYGFELDDSVSIVDYNDGTVTLSLSDIVPSAEDVALLLKKRAEEVDTGGE